MFAPPAWFTEAEWDGLITESLKMHVQRLQETNQKFSCKSFFFSKMMKKRDFFTYPWQYTIFIKI